MNRRNSGQLANRFRCQLAHLPIFFFFWGTSLIYIITIHTITRLYYCILLKLVIATIWMVVDLRDIFVQRQRWLVAAIYFAHWGTPTGVSNFYSCSFCLRRHYRLTYLYPEGKIIITILMITWYDYLLSTKIPPSSTIPAGMPKALTVSIEKYVQYLTYSTYS